jgi:hypothetical protein
VVLCNLFFDRETPVEGPVDMDSGDQWRTLPHGNIAGNADQSP